MKDIEFDNWFAFLDEDDNIFVKESTIPFHAEFKTKKDFDKFIEDLLYIQSKISLQISDKCR